MQFYNYLLNLSIEDLNKLMQDTDKFNALLHKVNQEIKADILNNFKKMYD